MFHRLKWKHTPRSTYLNLSRENSDPHPTPGLATSQSLFATHLELSPLHVATLDAQHFAFLLKFARILRNPSDTVDIEVTAVLEVGQGSSKTVVRSTETYLRWDEIHSLSSMIRDVCKLNGSYATAKLDFFSDGLGICVQLDSVRQYFGDPDELPSPPDEMPCSCGVSLGANPTDPALGGYLMAKSLVSSGAAELFASQLNVAIGRGDGAPTQAAE